VWRDVLNLGTQDEDLAGVGFLETGEQAQRRGLAAPGGTEEREELAGVHRHADVVDGDDRSEAFGQLMENACQES
jgi:hypothetical protein